MSCNSTVAFTKEIKIASISETNVYFLQGTYLIFSNHNDSNVIVYDLSPNPLNISYQTNGPSTITSGEEVQEYKSTFMVLKDTSRLLRSEQCNHCVRLHLRGKLVSNINIICFEDTIDIPLENKPNCNAVDNFISLDKFGSGLEYGNRTNIDVDDVCRFQTNCYQIYYYYILDGQGVISISYIVQNQNINIISIYINMVRDNLIATNFQ